MRPAPARRSPVAVFVMAALPAWPCAVWSAGDPATRIESPIVFVQIPAGSFVEKLPGRAQGMPRAGYGEGGRIVRLDPDGGLQVLTEGFSSACELDVSFDARRILFAAKRETHNPWNIWEMNADGSDARQITKELGNCRSPAYQSTLYTIVSTEPWYQIMFVSDAAGAMNEYGTGLATSLYSCRLDGSEVRRLTMNLSDDTDPFLMDDGRVLLASWQRMDLRRGPLGRMALFGVNTDGTDYALFCGDQGRRIKHMPCATTDGLVVFIEADELGWDGAGQLASVTVRRPLYSYRQVTRGEPGLFHSPSPLRDGTVLVSFRKAIATHTHGIYRLDPRGGRKDPVFDDPKFHDMHAKVLAPRSRPDGRSSVVNEKYSTGKLYCLNAYQTDPALTPQMRPGMIRRLRVIEGVPEPADMEVTHPSDSSLADTRVDVGGSESYSAGIAVKRLLSVVPVEEDGSFHIEVPADTPIQLQTLDANGMALRTCGWIWVKHREQRGCIGCHEDPELTPENRFVDALKRPANKLTLPAKKRRTVDFRRDVMPIIVKKCTACHAGQGARPDLRAEPTGQSNLAYHSLTTPISSSLVSSERVKGRYVYPGQARTSPLIWRIHGRNTSRPWDESCRPEETFPVCPPPEAILLTEDEKLTFVEWIDLGAHWSGIPELGESSAGAAGNIESESVK
ncbi:MAG: hypothetical protein JSU86_10015 [Phycisphaerales bacterium]|nr:MAG: hypothetical protein JSU86_10015 [Phycisphaerales bacterium]